MNEMDAYIPPSIRLIYPISKRFTTNRRFTFDELHTWVEQSKDLMLRSNDLCNIEPGDIGGILILRKMRKNEKV